MDFSKQPRTRCANQLQFLPHERPAYSVYAFHTPATGCSFHTHLGTSLRLARCRKDVSAQIANQQPPSATSHLEPYWRPISCASCRSCIFLYLLDNNSQLNICSPLEIRGRLLLILGRAFGISVSLDAKYVSPIVMMRLRRFSPLSASC